MAMTRRVIVTRLTGAAAAYFAAVFALGFVFGTLRVAVLEPWLGALGAVLVELPVMLIAAWWICGALIRRILPGSNVASRAAMGVIAFTLLIGAELALAALAFGATPAEVLAGWGQAPGLAGLLGQIAFAVLPVLRGHRDNQPG
jgi:hypothetical protein